MNYNGLEFWPATRPVKQLFILLHGVGGQPENLQPLAALLRKEFPECGISIPEATFPFEGGSGFQWYSNRNISEAARIERVAAALPVLHQLIDNTQQRFGVLHTDTALAGFSQGAIMALEYSMLHDGVVGRVLAFGGRFASLPEAAPQLTTLHLLHGQDDDVIDVQHAYSGFERLMQLSADATLDVATSIGHEMHPALSARAIQRLKTIVPLRSWKLAMQGI